MDMRHIRKELRTQQRREQILDAALKIFAAKGYDGASMPDIAHEAGIAVGTIYLYYENKYELLASLTGRDAISDQFKKVIEQLFEQPDPGFLSTVIEMRLGFGLDNMDKYLFLLDAVQRDPELRHLYVENVLGPSLNILENYLKSRIDLSTFRKINTPVIARAVIGMVMGLVLSAKLEGDASPLLKLNRKEVAAELVDFILSGINEKAT